MGECLARLRREAGLSQRELADRAGISLELVRKLEQNVRASARLTTLVTLARALNVPVSALLDPATSPGLLLRAARGRRGMSQELLAARAGITVAYVSMIENGHRPCHTCRPCAHSPTPCKSRPQTWCPG